MCEPGNSRSKQLGDFPRFKDTPAAFEVLRDSYEAVRGCTAAIETGHQQTLPLIVFF